MMNQQEKANAFRALHESGTFVIPNPWDPGSARMLQGLGFKALATTSAGFAQTLGRLDGQVTLDEKLHHCHSLSLVTDIPISADFENGFADAPEDVARNILKLAETGVVGASIEDYSASGIYDFQLAVDRVSACVEAVATLDFPFTLTARAENLLRGVADLDDTFRRLQAFETAGADVLYAPGLNSLDQVQQLVDEVSKPLNVLVPFLPDSTVTDFEGIGVRRLSVGGALANYSIGALFRAAGDMEAGRFGWVKDAAPGGSVKRMLS